MAYSELDADHDAVLHELDDNIDKNGVLKEEYDGLRGQVDMFTHYRGIVTGTVAARIDEFNRMAEVHMDRIVTAACELHARKQELEYMSKVMTAELDVLREGRWREAGLPEGFATAPTRAYVAYNLDSPTHSPPHSPPHRDP